MTPWLQVAALVPMAIAGRLRRIERRAVARAADAGATTAERAVLLEDAGALGHRVYRRLERAGVLIAAGNDRYYFSPPAYRAFRGRRRTRALLAVTALAAGIAIMYFRGVFE